MCSRVNKAPNKTHRHSSRKELPFSVLFFLPLIFCLILLLVIKKVFDIAVMVVIPALIFAFFSIVYKNILNEALEAEKKQKQSVSNPSHSYCSAKHNAISGISIISGIIMGNRIYFLVVLLSLELFASTVLAGTIPVGPAIYSIAIEFPFGLSIKKETKAEPSVASEPINETLPTAETETTESTTSIVTETEPADNSAPSLPADNDGSLNLNHLELTEPERLLTLPASTINNLLFYGDDWHIPKDANNAVAAAVIQDFILKKTTLQRADRFSLNASSLMQKNVEKATNAVINSSDDLDKSLMIHENAWYSGCDSFTLSKLIGNSYYAYGLAYYYRGNNAVTTESYMLISIQWRFESLEFKEANNGHIRSVLARISQAYRDISTIEGLDSDVQARALLLANAFETVKNSY